MTKLTFQAYYKAVYGFAHRFTDARLDPEFVNRYLRFFPARVVVVSAFNPYRLARKRGRGV